jgi:FtsH-binding integral membrane protein
MTPEQQFQTRATAASGVDAGLRDHMQRIYNRMTLGVFVTALTSWFVANTPALLQFFFSGPQVYLVMFAPLAVIWFGFNPMTMPASRLRVSFLILSVLYGISFAVIFLAFTHESIARAFFITAGMFAGLSIYGYTTRKNLDSMGSLAVMGIWGVFFLALLNIFVHSTLMQNVISGMSILAFSGLVAWQTQTMKEMYNPSYGDEGNSRMAWAAALNLYVSFIALFQQILYLTSNRR